MILSSCLVQFVLVSLVLEVEARTPATEVCPQPSVPSGQFTNVFFISSGPAASEPLELRALGHITVTLVCFSGAILNSSLSVGLMPQSCTSST